MLSVALLVVLPSVFLLNDIMQSVVMLSVVLLSVVLLSVVLLSVVLLSVVSPKYHRHQYKDGGLYQEMKFE
jgi:hypothetical protein